MKRFIYIFLGIIVGTTGIVSAATVFNSQQLAPNPSNGNCLTTNGATPGVNIWSSCGGGGGSGSGTVSTSTPLVAGRVDFSTSASTIGNDSTFTFSTVTKNLGFSYGSTTAFTVLGASYIPQLANLISNGLIYTAGSNGTLNTVATSTLSGTGLISVTSGAYVPGATPIVVSCPTCGAGTVTAISVATANGFAGNSSGGPTPALTLTTTINSAVLKGNGTAISGAANGTDYTLITANTCSAGNHVSAITAAGVITCSADSGGSGTFAYPFDITTYSGTTVNSTSTPIWLKATSPFSLIASSTGMDFFSAFGPQATSSIANALQIGGTIGDNALKITAGRVYPSSVSVGGLVNLSNSTINSGPALDVYTNFGAGATGRLASYLCDSPSFDQDCVIIDNDAANTTALNIKGEPTGKGVLKIEHTGVGTGFSNSSLLSLDGGAATDAQGIFMDWTSGPTTGKLLNLRNNGVEYLTLNGSGRLGISSTTINNTRAVINSVAGDAFSLWVGSTTNPWLKIANDGFGTTTLSGLNISGSATSTSNVGYNITTGCFSINSTCISGSGGGSGTVTSVVAGAGFQNQGLNITTSGTLVGALATSATPVISPAGLPYWTAAGDATTPARLGTTATTTLAGTGAISVSNSPFVIGGTPAVISLGTVPIANGGCNSTSFSITNTLLYFDGTRCVATSTNPLYVDAIVATSSTKASEIWYRLGTATTTPNYPLDSFSATTPQIALSAGAGVLEWTMRNAGGNFYLASTTVQGTATSTAPAALSVLSTGQVGIGTDLPTQVNANSRLTVAGLGAIDITASTTDNTTLSTAILEVYAPGARTFMGSHGTNQVTTQYGITVGGWSEIGAINSSFGTSNGLMIGTRTNATPIVLGNGGLERLRVASNGMIGVGTTTPFGQFQISTSSASATFKPQLVLTDTNAPLNAKHWYMTSDFGNFDIGSTSDTGTYATSSAFTISAPTTASPGTTFGIATTAPWRTLSVVGTVAINGLTGATGKNSVCIDTTTKELVDAGNTTCTLSSQFVKHDIKNLTLDKAFNILKLRPIQYLANEDNTPHYGFIAEEVAKVDPLLAEYAKEDITIDGHLFKKGDPISVDYARMTASIVRYIQDISSTGRRKVEENWQWLAIVVLFGLVFYQQRQINKLKK